MFIADASYGDVPAWLGLIGAGGAIFYAHQQVKAARHQREAQQTATLEQQKAQVQAQQETAEAAAYTRHHVFGQLLLQLDAAFQQHAPVHIKLRPDGPWGEKQGCPSDKDWPSVEAYLGLFERVKVMIDLGLLEIDPICRFYGYRVGNIWSNNCIRRIKLEERAEYWKDFIQLTELLEKREGRRYPGREHLGDPPHVA
jgi:hypothetical protein